MLQKLRPERRRHDRILRHAEGLRGKRRAVDCLVHRPSEAGCADDQNSLVRLRRDDRLVGRMRLQRQPLGPVGLDDHVVRQPGQRPDRQLRRAEFPVFRPRTHADAGAFLQRRGDLRLRRRDEAGHGLFGVDMRRGADDDAGLPRELMREPLHERGLSAAADDGRHTGSYLQRFRQVHGAYLPSVSFLKDNTRAVLRQEYRKNVDNPEPNMVKFRHGK